MSNIKDISHVLLILLVIVVVGKFFLFEDHFSVQKPDTHAFDSISARIAVLEDRNNSLESAINESNKKMAINDSLLKMNDKTLINELKRLKGLSNRRVVSVADSIYNSANR